MTDSGAQLGEQERRVVRAKEIASHPETIERIGPNEWSVPSQTGFGRYLVSLVIDLWRCSCPDYASRSNSADPVHCKHILAVIDLRLHEAGQSLAAPEKKKRKQYKQHPTYTKAQQQELRLADLLLRDLVSGVADFPRRPGTPGPSHTPLAEELYCAILKVSCGLSGRRAVGVYENVVDRKLLTRSPSYAVASNVLTRPEVTPILYQLLSLSAMPLAGLEDGGVVAPDSTGIQTTSFGAWREEKHREKRERKWIKVHAIVGTKTHVIIRAIVDDAHGNDAPKFLPLLEGALEDGFRPDAIVADMGYLSKANYQGAEDLGVTPYIPFKQNSVSRSRGGYSPPAWKRVYHFFQAQREEFDQKYHRRSNVEAVFSALKRKFREELRSRSVTAQVNEVLCKLIAYNLTVVVHEMFENGIAPAFVRSGSGPSQ